MDFTVELTMRTNRCLSQAALFDVAAIGGVSCGKRGGRRLETTLTVRAKSALGAAARGIELVSARAPGEVISVNAMTIAEADRRVQVV